MAPQKVSLYSLNELKTTLDDHLPVYLSTSTTPSGVPLPRAQRYTPIHTLVYTRLALGYAAAAIASYIFYLDYIVKKPFDDVKVLTAVAVVVYFILNGAFTGWMWFIERGLVFHGKRGDGETLMIRSHAPHRKYDPTYRVTVSSSRGSGKEQSSETSVPLTSFFSADGYFVPGEFEAWLKKAVPVIVESEGKKTS